MTNELVFEIAWSQIWQVLVLCVLAAITCRFLAKCEPRWCYLLWLVVLLKAVAPPVMVSTVGLFSWMRIGVDAMLVPAHQPVTPTSAIPFRDFVASLGSISPTLLLGIWLVGSIAYAACIYVRCKRFSRLLLASVERKDQDLQTLADSIAKRMGVEKRIRVAVTNSPIGPAVVGIRRPTVVIPREIASGKSAHELTPILAHEILHVKRRDTLLTFFFVFANVIWWFNPLVRFVASRVSQYSEHNCDLEVIRFLECDRASYARCLVNVLETKQEMRPILGYPGVRAL